MTAPDPTARDALAKLLRDQQWSVAHDTYSREKAQAMAKAVIEAGWRPPEGADEHGGYTCEEVELEDDECCDEPCGTFRDGSIAQCAGPPDHREQVAQGRGRWHSPWESDWDLTWSPTGTPPIPPGPKVPEPLKCLNCGQELVTHYLGHWRTARTAQGAICDADGHKWHEPDRFVDLHAASPPRPDPDPHHFCTTLHCPKDDQEPPCEWVGDTEQELIDHWVERHQYPTVWAYDQVCAALRKAHARAVDRRRVDAALSALVDLAQSGTTINNRTVVGWSPRWAAAWEHARAVLSPDQAGAPENEEGP